MLQLATEAQRFDIDALDHKLREKIGTRPYSNSPVAELLETIRGYVPRGAELVAAMKRLGIALQELNGEFESLNRKPDSTSVHLAFNNLLESPDLRNAAFANATQTQINAFNRSLLAYEQHVRDAVGNWPAARK